MNGAHANAPLPSLLAPMRCADPLERPRGWWQAERGSLRGGGERVRPRSPAAITCGVASPPMMCIHCHGQEIIVMNHPLSSALRRLRDLWGVDVLFVQCQGMRCTAREESSCPSICDVYYSCLVVFTSCENYCEL